VSLQHSDKQLKESLVLREARLSQRIRATLHNISKYVGIMVTARYRKGPLSQMAAIAM